MIWSKQINATLEVAKQYIFIGRIMDKILTFSVGMKLQRLQIYIYIIFKSVNSPNRLFCNRDATDSFVSA